MLTFGLDWNFEQLVYLARVFTSSFDTSAEHVISDGVTVGVRTLLVTVCKHSHLMQCNWRIPGACYNIRKRKKKCTNKRKFSAMLLISYVTATRASGAHYSFTKKNFVFKVISYDTRLINKTLNLCRTLKIRFLDTFFKENLAWFVSAWGAYANANRNWIQKAAATFAKFDQRLRRIVLASVANVQKRKCNYGKELCQRTPKPHQIAPELDSGSNITRRFVLTRHEYWIVFKFVVIIIIIIIFVTNRTGSEVNKLSACPEFSNQTTSINMCELSMSNFWNINLLNQNGRLEIIWITETKYSVAIM